MRVEEMPGSCAIMVIWDFDTSNKDEITKFVKKAESDHKRMKALVATTSTAGDRDWGENHRQNQENQMAAEEVLRELGYTRTRRIFNSLHHHRVTGIRIWWKAMQVEG